MEGSAAAHLLNVKTATYSMDEFVMILASSVRRPNEIRLFRNLRRWRIDDLLRPDRTQTALDQGPRYQVHEVRKGAVFLQLSRYMFAVGQLEKIRDRLDHFEKANYPAWRYAIDGSVRSYLEVMCSPEDRLSCNISVHPHDLRKATKAAAGTQIDRMPTSNDILAQSKMQMIGTRTAIVIALTELFADLGV